MISEYSIFVGDSISFAPERIYDSYRPSFSDERSDFSNDRVDRRPRNLSRENSVHEELSSPEDEPIYSDIEPDEDHNENTRRSTRGRSVSSASSNGSFRGRHRISSTYDDARYPSWSRGHSQQRFTSHARRRPYGYTHGSSSRYRGPPTSDGESYSSSYSESDDEGRERSEGKYYYQYYCWRHLD
jgi:hypothetical protein